MAPPLVGGAPRLRLRLLGLTDLHANLYPYDYYRDRPDNSVGLARTASLIAEARKESPNCLLFDNGDILQGTPLGDFAADTIAKDPKAVHPVIAAMNVALTVSSFKSGFVFVMVSSLVRSLSQATFR